MSCLSYKSWDMSLQTDKVVWQHFDISEGEVRLDFILDSSSEIAYFSVGYRNRFQLNENWAKAHTHFYINWFTLKNSIPNLIFI